MFSCGMNSMPENKIQCVATRAKHTKGRVEIRMNNRKGSASFRDMTGLLKRVVNLVSVLVFYYMLIIFLYSTHTIYWTRQYELGML